MKKAQDKGQAIAVESESVKNKNLTLTVFHEFKAAHSLEGFETPHFHLWKISAAFQAIAIHVLSPNGKLIDLVFLQKTLHEIIDPIEGTYLNSSLGLVPTSEKMAEWVWNQLIAAIPAHLQKIAPLNSVTITLCDLEGRAWGEAKLSE